MRRDLLIGVFLAALTLGVYWPVRTHEFVFYDDPQFITENPQIQSGISWNTVVYAFTHPVAGNWHPVTTMSHALDCEFFGLNAGAHHLVNAFLHAINALLLFLVLRRLTWKPRQSGKEGDHGSMSALDEEKGTNAPWKCVLVAVVFALHPLRVESVAWLSERKDLLSGFFFMLTLWCYALFTQRKARAVLVASEPHSSASIGVRLFSLGFNGGPAWVCYLLALVCFALGLMCKPMLVTLPFVLLLLDYWPLQRFAWPTLKSGSQLGLKRQIQPHPFQYRNPENSNFTLRIAVLEKAPFLFLSMLDCWITLAVQRSAGATQVLEGITWSERLDNAVTSYVKYIAKALWPVDLAIVYPHPAKHYFLADYWPGWMVALAAVLLLLVSLLCVLQARYRPYLAVGWFWYLGMLVPVIGLVQVGEQALADRYTYLPLIGPVMALAWLATDAIVRSIRGKGTSESSVFRGAINLKIHAARGPLVAALVLIPVLAILTRHQLEYWQNTVTLFDHAVSVTADNPSAQFALGVGLEREGQISKAMVRYRVAVAIDPDYTKAYYNMGQVLRKSGNWQQAADAYQAALRSSPGDLATRLNLASVLPHLGRAREAVLQFNEVLKSTPDSIEALNNLAWLLSTSADSGVRDGTRAIQLAEHACSLTGSSAPFLLGTLAAAYAETGRFAEAAATSELAIVKATEAGDLATAARNRELLEVYRSNRAYREEPETTALKIGN